MRQPDFIEWRTDDARLVWLVCEKHKPLELRDEIRAAYDPDEANEGRFGIIKRSAIVPYSETIWAEYQEFASRRARIAQELKAEFDGMKKGQKAMFRVTK